MTEGKVHIIRSFECDENDLSVAFKIVAENFFGSDPFIGIRPKPWSSRYPVPFRSVKISPSQEIKAVLGTFCVKGIRGEFNISDSTVQAVVRKSEAKKVENLLDKVKEFLSTDSIYKGKAITSNKTFMVVDDIDFDKLVYSSQVVRELEEHLWVLITKTKECREDGSQIQRKVLFKGKFGTGKSIAALLTIKKGLENGFTCFYIDPTIHDVASSVPIMLMLCKKYAPAILVIEDLDREQRVNDSFVLGKLMIAIDGVLSKGAETIIIFTTNFEDRIQGGFQRPGRIDKIINFDVFSAEDAVGLLKTIIPERFILPDSIDWTKVGNACSHMTPAFIRGVGDSARLAARSRAKEEEVPIVTEAILLDIIEGLQVQHKACEAASHAGFGSGR